MCKLHVCIERQNHKTKKKKKKIVVSLGGNKGTLIYVLSPLLLCHIYVVYQQRADGTRGAPKTWHANVA